jgi:CRISPR-associated protein Cas2
MRGKRNFHLITYDIRDPKRWRRAYRLLRGYGTRLQYSVFRISGTDLQISRLRWELQRILDPEDALLVIRLCRGCAESVCAHHAAEDWPNDDAPYKMVGAGKNG